MSRTYRLRHSKSRISAKWADGCFTAARSQAVNKVLDLVVHGIYNLPCIIEGQPNAYGKWDCEDYYWSAHQRTHEECMRAAGMRLTYNDIRVLERWISGTAWPISNLHWHPYARPGRS